SRDGSSAVTFAIVAGRIYFARVAASPSASSGQGHGNYVLDLSLTQAEVEPDDTLATATAVPLTSHPVTGMITPEDVDYFQVAADPGYGFPGIHFPADVRATGFRPLVSLLDQAGHLLAQAQTGADGTAHIDQFVPSQYDPVSTSGAAPSYYVEVQGPGGG